MDVPSRGQVLAVYCEARAGNGAQARAHLAPLISQRKTAYVAPDLIAQDYVALSDADAAFQWLDTAFSERARGLVYMGLKDWTYDPIRSDPRFKALERRLAAAADGDETGRRSSVAR